MPIVLLESFVGRTSTLYNGHGHFHESSCCWISFVLYEEITALTVRPGPPCRRMQTTQASTACCTDVFPVKIDELCNVNFLSNVEVTGSFLQPLAWYLTSKHTVPFSHSTADRSVAGQTINKSVPDDHSMQRCSSLKLEMPGGIHNFPLNVNESENAWCAGWHGSGSATK